jgi:hypothetical protein
MHPGPRPPMQRANACVVCTGMVHWLAVGCVLVYARGTARGHLTDPCSATRSGSAYYHHVPSGGTTWRFPAADVPVATQPQQAAEAVAVGSCSGASPAAMGAASRGRLATATTPTVSLTPAATPTPGTPGSRLVSPEEFVRARRGLRLIERSSPGELFSPQIIRDGSGDADREQPQRAGTGTERPVSSSIAAPEPVMRVGLPAAAPEEPDLEPSQPELQLVPVPQPVRDDLLLGLRAL